MSIPVKKFCARLAFLLLLPAVNGWANTDGNKHYEPSDTTWTSASGRIRVPEQSEVAFKSPQALHRTPASVAVVTRPTFSEQNGVVLGDALKNVSGVNVQSQFGLHDFFLIRGFDSLDNGLVLTDGAAELKASFYNLYNLERVEVLKGPSSFLYGANPLSGAVNLKRKQPRFRNFASVRGTLGRFATYRGTADVGFVVPGLSTVAVRVNGFWQGTENYRDTRNNESYAVNPAMTWRLSETARLTANAEFVRNKSRPDAGLPLQSFLNDEENVEVKLPDVPRTRIYQSPYDKSDQKLRRVRLDYRHRLSSSVTLRNKFYYTNLDWLALSTLFPVGALPIGRRGDFMVSRVLQKFANEQQLIGNQLEATVTFRTGRVAHELLTGIEASRSTDAFRLSSTALEPLDLFEPRQPYPIPQQLIPFLLFADVSARTRVFAPYAINKTSFSNKLQLFYGGRLDILSYDDERLEFAGVDTLFRAVYVRRETNADHQKFSPLLGVVLAPSEPVSLYANYSQSFGAPSSFLSATFKPEESTEFEVGAKLRMLGGRVNASLAVYHLEKENLIILGEDFLPERGTQRARGLEFELSSQLGSDWHAFLAYALSETKLTEFKAVNADFSGNTAPFAPRHILNFWTSKRVTHGLTVGAGLRYLSKQFVKANNFFSIKPYAVLDAFASYTFRYFRFSLNVQNLTNTAYETRSGDFSNSVIPAHPFAAYTSLEISL